MGSSIFKRGYKASRVEKKKQDDNRKKMAGRLMDFYLVAGEDGESSEAPINFLTEEPINFYQHKIPRADGKFDSYTCPGGKSCPYCAKDNKPTAQGAYLIVDERPFKYTGRDGNVHKGDKQLRMFIMGMRVVSQLDRISTKRGLADKEMTIVRIGSGQSTAYTFEDGDDYEYDEDEIRKLMPNAISEKWDGSKEGLLDVVEDQLKLRFPSGVDTDDDENFDFDDDEDDDDELDDGNRKRKNKKSLSRRLSGGKKKKSVFKKSSNEGFMDLDDDDDDDDIPFR